MTHLCTEGKCPSFSLNPPQQNDASLLEKTKTVPWHKHGQDPLFPPAQIALLWTKQTQNENLPLSQQSVTQSPFLDLPALWVGTIPSYPRCLYNVVSKSLRACMFQSSSHAGKDFPLPLGMAGNARGPLGEVWVSKAMLTPTIGGGSPFRSTARPTASSVHHSLALLFYCVTPESSSNLSLRRLSLFLFLKVLTGKTVCLVPVEASPWWMAEERQVVRPDGTQNLLRLLQCWAPSHSHAASVSRKYKDPRVGGVPLNMQIVMHRYWVNFQCCTNFPAFQQEENSSLTRLS